MVSTQAMKPLKILLYIHKRTRMKRQINSCCCYEKASKQTNKPLTPQTPWKGLRDAQASPKHSLRTTVLVYSFADLCFLYSGSCLKAESVSNILLCSRCPSLWTALTSPSLNLLLKAHEPHQINCGSHSPEENVHALPPTQPPRLCSAGRRWAGRDTGASCTGLCYGDLHPLPEWSFSVDKQLKS